MTVQTKETKLTTGYTRETPKYNFEFLKLPKDDLTAEKYEDGFITPKPEESSKLEVGDDR